MITPMNPSLNANPWVTQMAFKNKTARWARWIRADDPGDGTELITYLIQTHNSLKHASVLVQSELSSPTIKLSQSCIWNLYKISFTGCGRIVKVSYNGTVTSPNHPLPYDNNQDCTWIFSSYPGSKIRLNFIAFDLQPPNQTQCNDFVQIQEGRLGMNVILNKSTSLIMHVLMLRFVCRQTNKQTNKVIKFATIWRCMKEIKAMKASVVFYSLIECTSCCFKKTFGNFDNT